MMRSLFSGVAGLKTHQTRMDVIGNNIANVNTTAYKSQNMVFNDLLYQTTQAASGANAATGRGGVNPRQIGLGPKMTDPRTSLQETVLSLWMVQVIWLWRVWAIRLWDGR